METLKKLYDDIEWAKRDLRNNRIIDVFIKIQEIQDKLENYIIEKENVLKNKK